MQSPEEIELARHVIELLAREVAPLVALLLMSGFVFLGPVGRAIGEVIRRRLGGAGRRELEQGSDSAEVVAHLDEISRQIGEIAERQDFAERLLAQGRQERGLPGAGGGAG